MNKLGSSLSRSFLMCAAFAAYGVKAQTDDTPTPTPRPPVAPHDCVKTDPWDPTTPMTQGTLLNECVMSDEQRPAGTVQLPSGAPPLPEGTLLFSNFQKEPQFWLARLKPNSVATVFYETQRIPEFRALKHQRLRFHLKTPLDLVWPQQQAGDWVSAINNSQGQVSDVVVSVESGRTESTKDAGWGLNPEQFSYPLMTRIFADSEVLTGHVNGDVDETIELDWSAYGRGSAAAKLKSDLLAYIISDSQEKGYSEMYDLQRRNCVTKTFNFLDHILGPYYSPELKLSIQENPKESALPALAKDGLRRRKLIPQA